MISIVVRTYNEEKYLRKLLESFLTQSTSDFEIIIVDSGSTDSTLEIVEDFDCKLVKIKKEDFSFGRSLNYGCEAAKGEILVFISAHCIPTNNQWLENLTKPFENNEVALCYGRQIGYSTTKFSERQVFEKYFPEKIEDQQGGFFCNNANSAIRKSLWNEKHFDENLTGLEDMDWAKHFFYKGKKIQYVPSSLIYHIHEEGWRKIKIRYEREAFALKEIMPEIHFTFWDFIRALFRGISNDLGKNLRKNKFPSKIVEIFFFRLCQFYGSYRGNHSHRKLSKVKKTKYFYP
ncbi:MAG: glycosyltransferase family 2 protein [bacterium]|nr:glycosyltransferase family 2 protein [bacterium]